MQRVSDLPLYTNDVSAGFLLTLGTSQFSAEKVAAFDPQVRAVIELPAARNVAHPAIGIYRMRGSPYQAIRRAQRMSKPSN